MPEIRKIERKPYKPKFLKVAAYCRVSKDSERLQHSLSAQVSYYNELIQSTQGWEYAGVYSDEGLTGRNTDRPGFQSLMKACQEGKVNIVLCKSISRFARNTVDLLSSIRSLKNLGIDVRFEKEAINTLSEEGEIMLTLLASFAEQESKNMGENIKWSIRKGFTEGKFRTRKLYGYRWTGEAFEIIPEEAEIIRFIFTSYEDGMQPSFILKAVKEKGCKRRDGEDFTKCSITKVLEQEKYSGQMYLQKSFSERGKSSHMRNKGELPMYILDDALPAIITKECWDNCQERMRSNTSAKTYKKAFAELNPLNYKIVCGKCGSYHERFGGTVKPNYWVCVGKKFHKNCDAENIPQNALLEALEGIDFESIETIITKEDRQLEINLKNGETIERQWIKPKRGGYHPCRK